MKWSLEARAKINLTLQVLGRRPDGYHDLELIFQPVSLSDTLTVEETGGDGLEFACSVPEFENEQNLVCRGYEAMRERFPGRIPGLRIYLGKHIPAGAGLGGGSTDCSALLRVLNAQFELGLFREELFALGAGLGADVPACMLAHAAIGRGIGERLTDIETEARFPLIIAKPPLHFSTGEMYRRVDEIPADPHEIRAQNMIRALETGDATLASENLFNVFEEAVPEKERIAALKAQLISAGAKGALMTGSGSAVFGIFESEKVRDQAFEELKCDPAAEWFACETVNRREEF